MKNAIKIHCLIIMVIFVCYIAGNAGASEYPAPIKHKQTLTKILQESQVTGWPTGYELWPRAFSNVATSADGSKIAFTVSAWYETHIYLVNGDGTGLSDITSNLPEINYGLLKLNASGSRLFCGVAEDVYYCDTTTLACNRAIYDGIWGGDFRKHFSINSEGTGLFFKHDAGWDPVAEKSQRGLYYADVGGSPVQVMHIDELPCESECGNMNMLRFLGASADGNIVLFSWNRDYWGGGATSMWNVGLSGSPTREPNEEHDYIWVQQDLNNRIISSNGQVALYHYSDSGNPAELHAVDLLTGEKTLVAQINPDAYVALSPGGTYARLSGPNHNATHVNLATGDKRDTGSYYIPEYQYVTWLSDLTADDRYYFMGAKCVGEDARIHRVDMAPAETGNAPDIIAVSFSAPALLHEDDVTITVEVAVGDLQGLGTLEWVQLCILVDGRESPDYPMVRAPLAFPADDPGSTLLYDDGTHGDQVAGDGIYMFDAIATRKGDYDGWNTWYSHVTLPEDVGIRIIARDEDGNYCIADTLLTITDTMQPTCEGDFDHDGDVDGSDLALFAADFGRTDCASGPECEGDFDHDNDVDGSDPAVFAADFGRTDCPN